MSYELSASAKARLAEQRIAYVNKLAKKRTQIIQLAQDDLSTPEKLNELIEETHRLAGSAGLYKLAKLQRFASNVESKLRTWDGGDEQELRPALEQLLNCLEDVDNDE